MSAFYSKHFGKWFLDWEKPSSNRKQNDYASRFYYNSDVCIRRMFRHGRIHFSASFLEWRLWTNENLCLEPSLSDSQMHNFNASRLNTAIRWIFCEQKEMITISGVWTFMVFLIVLNSSFRKFINSVILKVFCMSGLLRKIRYRNQSFSWL